jgi:hypothetical protein
VIPANDGPAKRCAVESEPLGRRYSWEMSCRPSGPRHDGWDIADDAEFRIHLVPLEGIINAYDLI